MKKWSEDLIDEPLTEEQLEEIPEPYLDVLNHVALKGVQAGSIGGIIVGSASLLYRRPSIAAIEALHRIGRSGVNGAFWTSIGSIVVLNGILYREGFNKYRIWDRAYRLKHNGSQQRCDQFSLTGGLVGVVVGALVIPSAVVGISFVRAALAGGAIGISTGVIAHVATHPYEHTATSINKVTKAIETNANELTKPKK